LDFLAKAIEVLNNGEVTAPFGLWLVVHRDKKGREHKEGTLEKLAGEEMLEGDAFWLLMCCHQKRIRRRRQRRMRSIDHLVRRATGSMDKHN
jgi:hypothetical protein